MFRLSLVLLLMSNMVAFASWASRTLEKMSIEEKIGQLFMIAAYVDPEFATKETRNPHYIEDIEDLLCQYHVGGLVYLGPSECLKQVSMTNAYQKVSHIPLLIAQDLEWGLSMRLKDGMNFPKNLTLGVINDNQLIYEMGKEVGRQARAIGVHMNLSPVLDVCTEPENIAINVRSFGNSSTLVAEKGVAMIRGLQDAGVIASAKHFPGLGEVYIDPHLGLPYSNLTLQTLELCPFMQAIEAGVLSIQLDHIMIPSLEMPSSLSREVVTGILKKQMGFQGLVLSGALRMKALTEHFDEESIILNAFHAGNDILLLPSDLPKAHQVLKKAYERGEIAENEIEEKVWKILKMKEKLELHRKKIIPLPTQKQLHPSSAHMLKKQLYQNAVCLYTNNLTNCEFSKAGVLSTIQGNGACHGIIRGELKAMTYIQLGGNLSSTFFKRINSQMQIDHSFISPEESFIEEIDTHSTIILAIYPEDPRRIEQIRLLDGEEMQEELKQFRVHGLSETFLNFIRMMHFFNHRIIVVYFGNAFGLSFFDGFPTLIMAHENDPDAEHVAADLLEQIFNSPG